MSSIPRTAGSHHPRDLVSSEQGEPHVVEHSVELVVVRARALGSEGERVPGRRTALPALVRQFTIAAPTVRFVDSSIRMKEPVSRLRR
jgi:hypothetical protein